jgi:antirestriction protein ArdC
MVVFAVVHATNHVAERIPTIMDMAAGTKPWSRKRERINLLRTNKRPKNHRQNSHIPLDGERLYKHVSKHGLGAVKQGMSI